MIKHFDKYIFLRLALITVFVLVALIFIFIMIDFSENSDDFADQGAALSEIIRVYYFNYIPEMIRLVIPVAVFTACLFLTGQLTDRLEITALKAAGVSLYRLCLPYMIFGLTCALTISFLDSRIIPNANENRIAFEQEYIKNKSERIDRSEIYRQPDNNTILRVNYFDRNQNVAYRVRLIQFDGKDVIKLTVASKMTWNEEKQAWEMEGVAERFVEDKGYREYNYNDKDTTLNIYPRDLARTTSDIYQLTYAEAGDYINSIERSGAGGVNLPKVQYYGRIAYPISIIGVILIGFAFASVRRKGGKGAYLAAGLTFSFLYLALMKILEPFGYYGEIPPILAATGAHILFLALGIILLITARK